MRKRMLITGGAGFIGCNAAKSFAERGWQVSILDNLHRPTGARNLDWLRQQLALEFYNVDIRDVQAINALIEEKQFDVLIHLAGQVAVTTSVLAPRLDLEVNTIGTFNLLEATRCFSPHTIVINASTNKVYGDLRQVPIDEGGVRYQFIDRPYGIAEHEPLCLHSPYGCSKGAADQYVSDYARVYGIRTVNFRQSCIYGYRQFGVEDQGWASWFMFAHLSRTPITIFGRGKQVRDMLFVDDLIEAYSSAIDRIGDIAGQTFNIGGGTENSLSLLEFIAYLGDLSGRKVIYSHSAERPGDQAIFISDIRRAQSVLRWRPSIPVKVGLSKLYDWVVSNLEEFGQNATAAKTIIEADE